MILEASNTRTRALASLKSASNNISLWKNYFQQASGFVFVVDSIYRERIEDAKSFLYMVMDEIQGNAPDNAAVLVYSNIHFVPGAMSASEISNKLDLASCEPRTRFFYEIR
ncbi:hypothetical protein YC2023_121237 [Brassica napus]